MIKRLRQQLTPCLLRLWYRRNFAAYLLAPAAALYRLVITMRCGLYHRGLKASHRVQAPVIIVGNLTVGGTGKTPVVIALCQLLQQHGWRPGIISRGYGGLQPMQPYRVTPASDVATVGDEALLLAQTGCPVVICRQRVLAAQALLNQTDCNLIISDDGLQHYALARDIEIVVIDGERRFGNGFCLPAGPLREPRSRLTHADFLLVNGGVPKVGEWGFQLVPGIIYNLLQPHQTLTPTQLAASPVHAVAGIGHPQRFFRTLRQLGFTVIEHAFPDHHIYEAHELQFADDYPLLLTTKDAVKCQAFAATRFWCLPASAQFDAAFSHALLDKLHAAVVRQRA